MFKIRSFAHVLLGAASATMLATTAYSADPTLPDVALETGFNWSGFYVGVGGGFGANVHELSSELLPGFSFDGVGGEGVFGELTLGYDYMVSPRFLVGGFVDGHIGNIETSLELPGLGLDASVSDTHGFDAGLRLGYLMTPATLGYVLGGYAWQKAELDVEGDGFEWDRDGYFVGAGIETVISSNWTLKTEYRFTQFGTTNILEELGAPDGILDTDTSRHTFHVAANYRFGAQDGGGASFDVPAYNWTGFYVGAAGGAGAVVHQLDIPPLGGLSFNGIGGEGVFGELSLGYDHDFGNWVGGLMVDGSLSGITTNLDLGPVELNVDAEYGFDVLGRIGYKTNETTLAYVIGGYSWQHFDINASAGGSTESLLEWDASGFSVGGGIESAVSDKVTANLEYRYSQFETEDFDTDGFIEVEPSFHTVRVGFKYKFN